MSEVENPYNDPKNVEARKSQEDPWVMYIIVREDLGMSTGKACAQVGHAVGILYGYYEDIASRLINGSWYDDEYKIAVDKRSRFESWKKDSFRKIVLRAKDDKQWNKIKDKMECFVVKDAGLTEVAPGSETVIGLWPLLKSERPNILRKLQTLK